MKELKSLKFSRYYIGAKDACTIKLLCLILVSLFTFITGVIIPAHAQVWYVKSDGLDTNTGVNWSQSFATIQKAMDSAGQTGDEIWVKTGTYPLSGQINVDKVVAIYGGFSGIGNERDWESYITIVDGQSSVRCFYVTADATIDGFTITNGMVTGILGNGGGIFNFYSLSTINNCILSNNLATISGAGIYNLSSAPFITNCTFSRNIANTSGGGICNRFFYSSSPPAFPIITNCTFMENTAYNGGGIYNHSTPPITNCTFSGNRANSGGGIFNFYSSPPITNCILWDNYAPSGMEIFNSGVANPIVTYCDVEGGYGVPGDNNIDDDPMFVNVPLLRDISTGTGTISTIEVADATLYAAGDIIEIDNDGVIRTVSSSSGTTVEFDPLLAVPSIAGMPVENWGPAATDLEEDLHLNSGSPCIDTGDNHAPQLPGTDKDGKPRIIDGDNDGETIVDMGAYEFGSGCASDFDDDGDVDGYDLADFAAGGNSTSLETFAIEFGRICSSS